MKVVIEISAWGGCHGFQIAAVLLSDARRPSFWAQSIAMCMPGMGTKYFFISFIFSHPLSLRKSKIMPKTAYFEGSKTRVLGVIFDFRGLGGWQKMKTMKKYFQSMSGIHIAIDSTQIIDPRASESKTAAISNPWPPPSGWDFNNYLHINNPLDSFQSVI